MKDKKDTSDKEKDNDTSKSDKKDDNFKNKDKEKALIKITSDAKKESKWDTIDWSKRSSDEEKKESKWDTIDWSKRSSDEEKKESKWDTIDWSKRSSDEGKKESKWDTIDWSKRSSDEENKESKWDTIDWSKKSTDEVKMEEFKDDNLKNKTDHQDQLESDNESLEISKKNHEQLDEKEEFIEQQSINHDISMDHLLERDLKEIVKDIEKSEELRAIYAEDIMILNSDKEAVEKYSMEKMREDGIIITNDFYFENPDLNHEKVNPKKKDKDTEIDVNNMTLANDIEYDNKIHESMDEVKEINENQEAIRNSEKIEQDMPNSDVIDTKYADKEQEIEHKYSSGQRSVQILKKEVEILSKQEHPEFNDEIETKRQIETKEISKPEVSNEINKKKTIKEINEDQIKSSSKKEVSKKPTKKKALIHENIEQKLEFKEIKQESIEKELGFKEEWEKALVNWIKETPEEKVSSKRKEEVIEVIKKYRDKRESYKHLHDLSLKAEKKGISEQEKKELEELKVSFDNRDEKEEEMYRELNAFRHFYDNNKECWYDSVINSKKERYSELLGKKLGKLRKDKFNERQDLQDHNYQELLAEELHELYHQETNGNAIYNGEESKPFLQWLENRKKEENNKQNESENRSNKSKKTDGKWETFLIILLNQAEHISHEEKDDLIILIEKYKKLRDEYEKKQRLELKIKNKTNNEEEYQEFLEIKEKFENVSPFEKEIFKKFKDFLEFYEHGHLGGENVINWEQGQILNKLIQKYRKIKEIESEIFGFTIGLSSSKADDTERIAELADIYLGDLCKIFKLTKKEISVLLTQNEGYLYHLKHNIKKKYIKPLSYYKKLELWFEILEQELENRNMEDQQRKNFCNTYAMHLKDIYSYVKKELRIKYIRYRDIIKANGWFLETTFNEFCAEVIEESIRPSEVMLKYWCGKKGHNYKYKMGGFLKNSFQICYKCEIHGSSTTYEELIVSIEDTEYRLVYPSSKADWIKMIINSKKRPSEIPITLECDNHGKFSITPHHLYNDHGCSICAFEARRLTVKEIKTRGLKYGLKLVTPPNQIRDLLNHRKPLEWRCIKHKTKVTSHVWKSKLEKAYCVKCSKGRITDERVIRHMLNCMFMTTKFGNKPIYPYTIEKFKFEKIIQNQKIKNYLDSHEINKKDYNLFTIDCFGEVKIKGRWLWVSVDVWGLQHQDKRIYLIRFSNNTRQNYQRQKVYDNLRKLMFEKGLIDIHIVVPLWKLKNKEYNGFINRELKRQLLEIHDIKLNRLLPSYTWHRLLMDIRQAKDHQDII